MFWLRLAFASLIVGSSLHLPAAGQGSDWQLQNRIVDVSLSAKRDFRYERVEVFAVSEEGPTVVLSCSERFGLSALIVLKEISIEEIFSPERRRMKGRSVSIHAGDAAPKRSNWAYERKSKSLQSIKKWQAARVYNAVVTQDVLHLNVSKLGKHSFTLPAINDDFRKFKSVCPAV